MFMFAVASIRWREGGALNRGPAFKYKRRSPFAVKVHRGRHWLGKAKDAVLREEERGWLGLRDSHGGFTPSGVLFSMRISVTISWEQVL